MFKCSQCGLCCMNLKGSALYNDLDRGDGICIYFDYNKKLCKIYETRPDKCNIDKMYEKYYRNKISKEKFYQLNYEACEYLKERGEKDVFSKT